MCQSYCLSIINFVWFNHNPNFTASLNSKATLNAFIRFSYFF